MSKMLLLDLDGTLLHTDKSISDYTLSVLEQCKENNIKVAVATARGESNVQQYITSLNPDIIISSGGALARLEDEIIFCCEFNPQETAKIIATGFELTDNNCEITVDTLNKHYWNYNQDPHILFPDWGDVIYTDYSNFNERALKICVEIEDEIIADRIAMSIDDCDYAKFSDGNWYKFTRKSATKSSAIMAISKARGVSVKEMIAFGDDFVDMEMLKICGVGVAMGRQTTH